MPSIRDLKTLLEPLGAGPFRVFFTISLPLMAPGILTGVILAFARSLGEFGATITFVSNIPGETRTLPLALYSLTQVPGGETGAMRLLAKSEPYVHFDQVVRLLGIDSILDRRPARLSGGEKQRVAIGRGFLCNPALLLMDEPLASLDAGRKSELLPFIRKLNRKFLKPILYVSHMVEEVERLADHIVLVNNGGVSAAGLYSEIKKRYLSIWMARN